MFEYYKSWMEFWFLVLILVGLAVALLAPSAFISYLISLISGFFAGRIVYERKHNILFPYIMIIAGFTIGYIIGVYYASRWIVFAMFALGAILSYKLYDKKILSDTRF